MDKKELIWVDKEFALRWNKLEEAKTTRDEQEKVFDAYMASVTADIKRDFRATLDGLDEDAAIFTGLILKVKQAFEKAKNEHLTASYQVWENFDKEAPNVSKKTQSLIDTIKPLKSELQELNKLLGHIDTSQIECVITAVNGLNALYGSSKEMIEFLINNFKKE
jgi:hypothetical protein